MRTMKMGFDNSLYMKKQKEHILDRISQFDGKLYLTKQMVADFYEVSLSTVDRYLEQNAEELKHNGYVLCKGKALKEWKLQFGHLINDATKTTILGLFDFRSFLNMGMLLSESEKAKKVRSLILDIVITTINERAGGGTKYINWREWACDER